MLHACRADAFHLERRRHRSGPKVTMDAACVCVDASCAMLDHIVLLDGLVGGLRDAHMRGTHHGSTTGLAFLSRLVPLFFLPCSQWGTQSHLYALGVAGRACKGRIMT